MAKVRMMKNKDGLKQTEIGLIPEDWNVVKLEDVAEINSGGNAPQGEKYFRNGKYSFVRVQHFDGSSDYVRKWDLVNDLAIIDYNLKLFPKNSIVFPKSGASIRLEKRAILPFDSYVVSHLCILIPKKELIESKFLFYLLKILEFAQDSGGTTLPYLNLSYISDHRIPLPPILEQQKISKVLSNIQQAVEQQDKIIEATKNLKRSLMQKLFTEGLGHAEFKETQIGQIPKSWEVMRLGEVAEVKYGYSTRISKVSEKGGIPIISMADITPEGKILWDKIRTIKVNDKVKKKHKLTSGEVLFNWRNSPKHVGKTAVFDMNDEIYYICASFLLRIATKPDALNNKFLHYQLSFMKVNGYFSQRSRRAVGQTNFNASVLRNMCIFLPPLPEQQEVAYILSTIDKKIEAERKRKATVKALFRAMLHKLMTGEIRLKDIEV